METKRIEAKKMKSFRIELVIIAAICALAFVLLGIFMNTKSTQAISSAGGFYMEGISRQISSHFETTIELRLKQVESIVESVETDDFNDTKDLYNALVATAKSSGFNHLALLSQNGKMQILYGKKFKIVSQKEFLDSLNNNELKVAMGIDSAGESVILLGASAAFQMNDEGNCTALVAALPVDYITETLSLEIGDSQTYSFIIQQDGSYVIRTDNETHDNYFDRVKDVYDEINGVTPEMYTEFLKKAMKSGEDYSSEMMIKGEKRQLYCVKLNYSEWYLLTFLPYGVLNETIHDLSSEWMLIALIEVAIILTAIAVILISYLRIYKRQMQALEDACKTAEASKRKAEMASKAKSEFLSNVSHDIRTPMNAIVGMTAIARTHIDDKKRLESCLEKIDISGKHLLGLINNVLDMSKIENGKMTLNMDQVSLRELMDNMVNIVKPSIRAKNQKFDVVIHDIISENVCCDSVRLNQVIINFLSNAVKFTPENGEILMTLYQKESKMGDDYVQIHLSVKDNGIGMSEELKERVFESFVREDSARVRKTEGTGLGMAITKYIVDAMGGTIEVDSELGVGSEFRVTVDLKKVQIEEETMVLPNWNILIVDDDKNLCESVVSNLREMGANADWTLDGESAIKMIKANRESGKNYQFVLLDWKLPNMDGIETARKIHEILGDDLPILMTSAYDCNEIEDEAQTVGITEFISKPLFKSTLFYGFKKFMGTIEENAFESENRNGVFYGKKILLAEDNELNWEIAESLLSEFGFELEWAKNGKICVDKFKSAPDGYYDVIFMDIRMPVMTGYEATKAIRACEKAQAKTIPIIAMTADAFADDVKKCLDCGMNAHVAKPINVGEIERLLEKFLC